LAAVNYLRGHFEDATEIYRKLALENRDYIAINVYIALCYYKLDYYDVSLDVLTGYKNQFPTSVIAQNLVVFLLTRHAINIKFIMEKPLNKNLRFFRTIMKVKTYLLIMIY